MAFEAFATASDYRSRFPETSSSDEVIDAALLDASLQIADVLDHAGIEWDNPTEREAFTYKAVCLNAAHRAIGADENEVVPFGATQFSQSASPYSFSATMGNPYGEVKLWPSEKERLIGYRTAAAFSYPGGA